MKIFFSMIFCIITVLLTGVVVFADTTVSITNAEISDEYFVSFSFNIEDCVTDQQINVLVLKYNNNSLDFDSIVYINQYDYEEGFSTEFTCGDWIEEDAVYAVRVGGSEIDLPAVFIFDDEGIIYGDVNNDGIIAADDAALTLQYVLNQDTAGLTQKQIQAAAVNGSTDITAYEASCILSKALNASFTFKAEE